MFVHLSPVLQFLSIIFPSFNKKKNFLRNEKYKRWGKIGLTLLSEINTDSKITDYTCVTRCYTLIELLSFFFSLDEKKKKRFFVCFPKNMHILIYFISIHAEYFNTNLIWFIKFLLLCFVKGK